MKRANLRTVLLVLVGVAIGALVAYVVSTSR